MLTLLFSSVEGFLLGRIKAGKTLFHSIDRQIVVDSRSAPISFNDMPEHILAVDLGSVGVVSRAALI